MRDINSVRLSGTIFWSKLDERPTFTLLRMGIKLGNGSSLFCLVNNPDSKAYEIIKPGNKVLIGKAWFDYWEERKATQVKAYGSNVQFFHKETSISDLAQFTVLGKILQYSNETVLIEMIGDRNPKTGEWAKRRAEIKIGDKYENIEGKHIFAQGELSSIDVDRKTQLVIEANYDKITIL